MSLYFSFLITVLHTIFFLLHASTISLISGKYGCTVIDCEYPYSLFFLSLVKYSYLNVDLKVNSRNRIEWLQQIFLNV